MAQILVRDLDEDTLRSLKKMAQLHHRSLQGEVKALLVENAKKSAAELSSSKTQKPKKWPHDFLKTIYGSWQGEPLVRDQPVEYDKRDSLNFNSEP